MANVLTHTHPPPTSSFTHSPLTDLLEAIPELGEDITNHPGSTLNYMALALHTVSQLEGGGGGRKGAREGREEESSREGRKRRNLCRRL